MIPASPWAQQVEPATRVEPPPAPSGMVGLVFVFTLAAFAGVLSTFSTLYDADSYYHLAVARRYWDVGIHGGLSWARYSVMSQGFGDKEFLFHVLLMPFVALSRGSAGGFAAVALLNAAIAAMVGHLAMRAVGPWGALAPAWVLLGSADFTGRVLRLRPELLALLLFLLAVRLAAGRRYRSLAVLAAVFALSYTAFQALLLLCAAWLLYEGLARRNWEWDLLAYPLLGTVLGLFLHPHFPANIHVWLMQNAERYRQVLPDAGAEFALNTIRDALELNAGWWLGLLILWRAGEARSAPAAPHDRLAGYLAVAAALFGLLFAVLSRFATFFVAFVTLAVLFEMTRRGLRISGVIRLPWRGRIPLALGVALVLLLGVRTALVVRWNLRYAGVFVKDFEEDGRRFGRLLPEGARVAASWSDAEYYSFWAPQAQYLNVLDPIFMAAWRPVAYRAQASVLGGQEPDVPLRVATELDSDYLALLQPAGSGVGPRLRAEPRLKPLYLGRNALYALVPDANDVFVLDWRVAPKDAALPPVDATALSGWIPYPRAEPSRARRMEGFVDARRVSGADECVAFSRAETVATAGRREYELASYGPATFWIDREVVVAVLDSSRAVLGRGVRVPLSLSPGTHTFTVRTCPANGYAGFYLVAGTVHPPRD